VSPAIPLHDFWYLNQTSQDQACPSRQSDDGPIGCLETRKANHAVKFSVNCECRRTNMVKRDGEFMIGQP